MVEIIPYTEIEKMTGRVFVVVEDILTERQIGRIVENIPYGHRKPGCGVRKIIIELFVIADEIRSAPQADFKNGP